MTFPNFHLKTHHTVSIQFLMIMLRSPRNNIGKVVQKRVIGDGKEKGEKDFEGEQIKSNSLTGASNSTTQQKWPECRAKDSQKITESEEKSNQIGHTGKSEANEGN